MLLCLQVYILINDMHQTHISDFGSARMDLKKSVIRMPQWTSLELHDLYVDNPLTTQASDVWAFTLTIS